MDNATAERPGDADAQVFAAVGTGRSAWRGVFATLWTALAIGYLIAGDVVQTTIWGLGALAWGLSWWAPSSGFREVTSDALVLREGLRTRRVPRTDVVDVQPEHHGRYGLVVSLRDDDPVELSGTAPRFSVAAAQAAALRRWAGLPE